MTAAVAAIGVGVAGIAAGAYESSEASKKAASAQQNAATAADNTQLQMYNQTRTDQTPWRNAGTNAIGALNNYYGLPTTNANGTTTPAPDAATTAANDNKLISSLPGYQFNLQQGQQAVQRNLASQGLLDSGAAAKALTQYGQGVATQATGQYLNGLQSIAGIGQTATAQTGAVGANAANQIGSNQIYSGNAQASGYANQSNAINSGLSGLTGAFGQYNTAQNLMYGPSYQGGTTGNVASGTSDAGFDSMINNVYQQPSTYVPN